MIAISLACSFLLLVQEPLVSKPDVLSVGQVVEFRGGLDPQGHFVAEKAELEKASTDDVLIGMVPENEKDPRAFTLLGQLVVTDVTTQWKGLTRGSVAGKRIKVEGSWKGPRKFLASSLVERGPGRDRIGGRIDELARIEGGWEATVMIFRVRMQDDMPVEHELPVEAYALAKAHKIGVPGEGSTRFRSEEDVFGKGIQLGRGFVMTGQLEVKRNDEDEFDLDESLPRDRTDDALSARTRLSWAPGGEFSGMLELRYNQLFREQQSTGFVSDQNGLLGETFVQWEHPFGATQFEATLGRQDFDDEREWLYDQNLDGLRVSWERQAWHLELAAATTLTDGSPRDNEADNWSLYLDNNDRKKHLAIWALYRDIGEYRLNSSTTSTTSTKVEEQNLHAGARAIGEFLPQNESWFDIAVLSGSRDVNSSGSRDILGWAYDMGTTWSPPLAAPLYFTIGYALGSGDDSTSGTDGTFRQTGLQDNTAKFGGVTSFQYYGELINPELSNLGIFTVGVGGLLAKKTSLDLVYHTYTQDIAKNELSFAPVESSLRRAKLSGTDADIGSEVDLIFGYRQFASWDMELVGAWFQAGDAFTVGDDAFLAKIQLRYRF